MKKQVTVEELISDHEQMERIRATAIDVEQIIRSGVMERSPLVKTSAKRLERLEALWRAVQRQARREQLPGEVADALAELAFLEEEA